MSSADAAGDGGRPRTHEAIHLPLGAGGTLRGQLSHAGEPGGGAVLYVHGFGSVRGGGKSAALEAACARRGWTFVAFDFRGHGESSGSMLELRGSGLLEDLEAARTYLDGRGFRRLYLVGSSMGGWAASWFTLRHPGAVPACVLLAPAFDFPRGIWARLDEAERRAWRRTGRLRLRNDWVDVEVGYGLIEDADQFPVERLAGAWRTPLLIVHGMRDDVVPYAGSVALVERMTYSDVELRLLKKGEHRLEGFWEEVGEAACAFFARRGLSGPSPV
jgi:pimeloyl-ACP methyl ester carboxylesterase